MNKVIIIYLLIVSAIFTSYGYSAEKLENDNSSVRLRIILISGEKVDLENAQGGPWELKSANFYATLSFSDFKKADRVGENLFRFFLLTGKTVEGALGTGDEFFGQSDWGTFKVKWSKVKVIEVVQAYSAKEQPKKKLDTSKFPIIVKLIDDKIIRFSEIMNNTWKFNLEGFESELTPNVVKKIQRLKDGIYKIFLKEGLSFKGFPFKESNFEGVGEQGKLTIPWSKISLIDLSNISLEQEKAQEDSKAYNPANVKLKSGVILKASDVNIREVKIDEFEVYIDEKKIRSFKSINIDEWEISPNVSDTLPFKVSTKDEDDISVKTTFAFGTIPLNLLESVEFINPPTLKTEKLNWILTTKIGTKLKISLPSEEKDVHSKIAEIGKLTTINLSEVKEIKSQGKEKPYVIIFNSEKKYQVEPFTVSGSSLIGDLRICGSDKFEKMLRIRSDEAKLPRSVVAKIELKNGDILDAFSLSGQIVDNEYYALDNATFQYWIHKDLLEKRPWKFKENLLFFKDNFKPNEIKAKTLPKFTVSCSYGELEIYSKAISTFTPSETIPPNKRTKTNNGLKFELKGKNNSTESFQGKGLSFVRYPSTVWQPYMYYPSSFYAAFHFYRFDFVPTTTSSGLIEIPLNKIAKIKIVDNYSEEAEIVLENLKGNNLKGKIKKEEQNVSYEPAIWNLEKDAILLELTELDGYLFVPFNKVKEIIFRQ